MIQSSLHFHTLIYAYNHKTNKNFMATFVA